MSEENQSMDFDAENDFLGASISVEDQAFGPQFPIIQWVNGSPRAKALGLDHISYTGGFFISADQGVSSELLLKAGFSETEITTNKGDVIKGYAARSLEISPIRFRRCWQVQAEAGGQRAARFAWDDYDSAIAEGKARGVCHLLVHVHGIDKEVFAVSFRGTTARDVLGQGKDRGLIPTYANKIPGRATRIAKAASKKNVYPLCAFKLTIAAESSADGLPVFTEVGSKEKNNVTRPVWLDEPDSEVTAPDLRRLFVGNALFAELQDVHRSADAWVDAWSSFGDSSSAEAADEAGGQKSDIGDHEVSV